MEEWIQSVASVLEQGWNDQSVFPFLYMIFKLISFVELRHKGHLDSMNSLPVLIRFLGPKGSQ